MEKALTKIVRTDRLLWILGNCESNKTLGEQGYIYHIVKKEVNMGCVKEFVKNFIEKHKENKYNLSNLYQVLKHKMMTYYQKSSLISTIYNDLMWETAHAYNKVK